ncbi:MAG TPA: hypothetical protein VLD38_06895 [Nitrosopumilaceae archaeon]|nr:hypothetical protein [Nitrosopumilaceae archaeon]
MSSIPPEEKTFFLQEGCFVVGIRNLDLGFADSSKKNENAIFRKVIDFSSVTIKGLIQDNYEEGADYLKAPFSHQDLLPIQLDKKKKSGKGSHD